MGEDSNHQPSQGCRFPDWPVKLQADGSLNPGLRASYRVTILGFLEFCRRRRTAPAVAAAREYVEVIWLFEAWEGTPRLMAELMGIPGILVHPGFARTRLSASRPSWAAHPSDAPVPAPARRRKIESDAPAEYVVCPCRAGEPC